MVLGLAKPVLEIECGSRLHDTAGDTADQGDGGCSSGNTGERGSRDSRAVFDRVFLKAPKATASLRPSSRLSAPAARAAARAPGPWPTTTLGRTATLAH